MFSLDNVRIWPVLNAATTWIPESGAQMDWIAAVRLGWNATELILHAAAALAPSSRYPMFPNPYGTDGGKILS